MVRGARCWVRVTRRSTPDVREEHALIIANCELKIAGVYPLPERLCQIVLEIVQILKAYGDSDQSVGDAERRALF